MSELSEKEISKIINLYNNSKLLETHIMNSNINNLKDEEFYLVNKEWVENFKKVFEYNHIIELMSKKLKPKTQKIIKSEDKKKLKLIRNKPIIQNSQEEAFNTEYYLNFYLIHHTLFKEIAEGYHIDEKIKYDIKISKGIFAMKLNKKIIEFGKFSQSNNIIDFDSIFLLKFDDKVDLDDEINNIIYNDIFQYLRMNNVNCQDIQLNKEVNGGKFKLILISINPQSLVQNNLNNINYNQNMPKSPSYGLNISNKKCFDKFNSPNCSRLNAIIQLLTSVKELYDYIKEFDTNYNYLGVRDSLTIKEKKSIKKLNHIFIFTSFFQDALNEIYTKNNVSLENMDIILNFLDQECSNKDLYNYILLILQNLHNELIEFPGNLQKENLESYNSSFSDRQTSYQQFIQYYNSTYKHSCISNLFNWMRLEYKLCINNNYELFSFQAFPLIQFDLDEIYNFMLNNKILNPNSLNSKNNEIVDIDNCFDCYSKMCSQSSIPCPVCNNPHPSNYFIQCTQKYLILVIKRNKQIKLKYSYNLDIRNYINDGFPTYTLSSVIIEETGKYSCLIRDESEENYNKRIWKKFSENQIYNLSDEKEKNNEVLHPFNSRVLLYKALPF